MSASRPASQCSLRSIHNLHETILIPNKKEIIIGRGPLTKVSDKRCSRQQVSLTANPEKLEVFVKQIGENSSAVNGLALGKNKIHTLKHGDRLELLFGEYIYQVDFRQQLATSPQGTSSRPSAGVKRPSRPSPPISQTEESKSFEGLFKKKLTSNGSGLFIKPVEGKWESIDGGKLLVYTPQGLEGRRKIASYDLDHTVITTQTGKVFPTDIDDWRIAYSQVPGKLKQLWSDGYKIVFFTNQGSISKGKLRINDFKSKVTKIISKLGVPVQTFVSTGSGVFRKPAPGMWDALVNNMNCGVKVDMQGSFYCGDAAGRVENWAPKKKKDFSCSDRLFALNVGITFYTPEEHFLQERSGKYSIPEFNSAAVSLNCSLCEPESAKLTLDVQEVIVLVGFPGSGKSFFAKTYLVPSGYLHVNRDTLGSWQRCVSTMVTALQSGQSVVVDNTNPDRESRHRFIEAANNLKITSRCFVFSTTKEHCVHNNKFREYTDISHQVVSNVIINFYNKKYEEPSLSEGFSDIIKINFVPMFKNSSTDLEKLYKMYL